MKRYIEVYYCTPWDELRICRIPGVYKHRERVNELLQSLNNRYLGVCAFRAREFCEAGKPIPSLREIDRHLRRRYKHGLTA